MNINDAKKVMLDRVNLAIDEIKMIREIENLETKIQTNKEELEDAEYEYKKLEHSSVKKVLWRIMGRANRLQELEDDIRRTKGNLNSTQFELESCERKLEEIQQTLQDIERDCADGLQVISEVDGEDVRHQIFVLCELPKLCDEITKKIQKLNPIFENVYNVYRVGEPTASCLDGQANNRSAAMRKQSKIVATEVSGLAELLHSYHAYAPKEIQFDFHDNWMDNAAYWKNQVIPEDSLDRIKKVENWVYEVENRWKYMKTKQTEVIQKLQEEVFEYLDT